MKIDNSTSYLIINAFLYLITFIIYLRKKKVIIAGKIILLIYACSAFGAIFLYNNPESHGEYQRITLFPFIYLYTLFILSLNPLLNIDKTKIISIIQPSKKALNVFIIVILIFSLPSAIDIIINFKTTFLELMAGPMNVSFNAPDIYAQKRGGFHFFSIIQGLCLFLMPLGFFYYITLENKKTIVVIGLFIAMTLNIFQGGAMGARGDLAFDLFVFLFLYLFFNKFMNKKTKKIFLIFFGLFSSIVVITFVFITLFKFGRYDDNIIFYYNNSYFSQCFLNFNNYGLDAGGVRFGTRTATLITAIINPSLPVNYPERISAFSSMKLNESHFYTYIGEFTLDYGPVLTLIIFLLFYFIIRKLLYFNGKIPFYKIVPLYFILRIFAAGWTQYPFCNFAGNLQIIAMIIVYFYFKNDYLNNKRKIPSS